MDAKIVFFDMDHTLMDNDCDMSWKEFLIDRGLADASERDEKDRYFQQYLEGRLDVEGFLAFQLRQFRGKAPEELAPLIRDHFEECVLHRIYPQARAIIDALRTRGVPRYLLTATNEVIAAPVAEHLRLDGMLATRLEIMDGRYTGKILPPYCIAGDKIGYAEQICRDHGVTLTEAAYYGDSSSDIPILEAVGHAVAVNPNGLLLERAEEARWPIERWTLEPA